MPVMHPKPQPLSILVTLTLIYENTYLVSHKRNSPVVLYDCSQGARCHDYNHAHRISGHTNARDHQYRQSRVRYQAAVIKDLTWCGEKAARPVARSFACERGRCRSSITPEWYK